MAAWSASDPGWFPADLDGVARPAGEFRYRSRPIPFRDLPFGSTWRLGRGGTSSNRQDHQWSVPASEPTSACFLWGRRAPPSVSEVLEPLRLDPLTVEDDPDYRRRLCAQGNLPESVSALL